MDPQWPEQIPVAPPRWTKRSTVFQEQLAVTFADANVLHKHLHAVLQGSRGAYPRVAIAPFEWMCRGRGSESLRSEWGHSKYALLGEAESDDGLWRVTLGVNIGLVISSESSATRNSPRSWTAFFTYQRAPDTSRGTIVHNVVEAEVDVYCLATDGTQVLCQRADLPWGAGSYTTALRLNVEAINDILWPSVDRNRPIDGPIKPFRINFTLTYTVSESRAFPFPRLPDVALQLVAEHLSLIDVQHLSQAVPELRANLRNTPTLRVRRALRPYFDDVPNFLAVLGACGAIVGGSLPLSVLRPGDPRWEAADLDLVVEPIGYGILREYLAAEGYVLDDKRTSLEYPAGTDISFGFNTYTRGQQSIDVCIPFSIFPDDFPLTYHCTAAMNYISSTHIVCFFPHHTFKGHFLRNLFTPTERLEHGIQKYLARGYTPVPNSDIVDIQDPRLYPPGMFTTHESRQIDARQLLLPSSRVALFF